MKRLISLLALITVLCAPMLVRADTDPINGSWRINGQVAGFPVTVRCDFERNGDKLGGVCHDGDTGKEHVLSNGSVHGDQVTWSYRRQFLAAVFEPRYSGQIEGYSMKGAITVAGHNGAFTGDRE
jgi:hypothetical protein